MVDGTIQEGGRMIVCIAEKPSVARDIAKVLGANTSHEGYLEGNGYQVTWTYGHLCTLKEPNDYQVIVAIKCMDEGIDIPTADVGILMASSTNPREYIQRIGRIIRQSPNKLSADLYDICVDTINCVDDDYIALERKIRVKEQTRLREIAENAINSIDALTVINSLD